MRSWHLVAAMTLAVVSVEPGLSAQRQQQIFISLMAPDGTAVAGLQASDVGVTEDDVECKITKVEAINWPTKVHVLVDNGKFNTTPINGLRDGLRGLFEQIPDGVEMSLYVTAGTPRPIVKPTTDKQKLLDGIGLIAPDSGVGMFFDALSEAADRIAKDKTPNFPVILMVASDFGKIPYRDPQKLQETIVTRGIAVHISMMTGGGSAGGGAQTELGLAVTKLSGGRYEAIAITNRLATLLPEFGQRIAESEARQSHQYRVTYERPANAAVQPRITASVRRDGIVRLSRHGSLP